MPDMPDFDEEALKELNNIDAARLAIRGALATIRDLQDLTAKLKAEVQDESSRRKLADSRVSDLAAQVERWQEQAKRWEDDEKRRAADQQVHNNAVRLQVRAEEKARIQEHQKDLEEALARLQAELQQMAASQREKEERWEMVKKRLKLREVELVSAEREKVELSNRYRRDMEALDSMREARDREIAASIKSRELELEERNGEIAALKRHEGLLQQALAATAQEQQLKLQERDEKLAREYLFKEQALQERYSKREMELQSAWSEIENGLWKRAKEARESLDKAAAAQFEERARSLADRKQEMEAQFNLRRMELDEDFKRRCTEAEARYADAERTLRQGWAEKEDRFLKQFNSAVESERVKIKADWDERFKSLERHKQELGAASDHLKAQLLEEAAYKDAERLRKQDDFVAQKTAELETAAQERESARKEAFAAQKQLAENEINGRRVEAAAEHVKSMELARAALDKRFEEHAGMVDASYDAKVAELARAHKAGEERLLEFKAQIAADHALKEKNLDSQWAAREQELVTRNDTQLASQRRDFETRLRELQEAQKAQQVRGEAELQRRRNELEGQYDKRDREMNVEWARREAEQRHQQEARFAALRETHEKELETNAQNAAAETARVRADLAAQLGQVRKSADDADLRRKQLEEQVAEAGRRSQTLWDELQGKQRAWEVERLALEQQYRQREVALEGKYQEMERALQTLWTQKETEAVDARLKSLEKQHQHYIEQAAKSEETQREAFEEWRRHETTALETQKSEWLAAREKDLGDRRKALEAHYEQRIQTLNGEFRKREAVLERQTSEFKAQARVDMEESLREREKAFLGRIASMERELADLRKEPPSTPPPTTDEPPAQQP